MEHDTYTNLCRLMYAWFLKNAFPPTYVRVSVCVCVHVRMRVRVRVHACLCVRAHACLCVCAHACVCVRTRKVAYVSPNLGGIYCKQKQPEYVRISTHKSWVDYNISHTTHISCSYTCDRRHTHISSKM